MPRFTKRSSRSPSLLPLLASCGVALGVLLLPMTTWAAQIVVFDLKPAGKVASQMAKNLSPIMLNEMAKQNGMSIVSQADIRALLKLEGEKQAMGCEAGTCLADIASGLGAEMLATSTLSKVGKDWVVSMTLIEVESGKVLRRSTGRGRGKVENAAITAVEAAVHQLFNGALPRSVQGPASMTPRGFKAALAGLHQQLVSFDGKPDASRKKVVLDLVATELDYDAEPKMKLLERQARYGYRDCVDRVYTSKNAKGADHFRACMAYYDALTQDLGRVKEIRERARAQGITPTSRPLRFLPPDPQELPSPADVTAFQKLNAKLQKQAQQALSAYLKRDAKKLLKLVHKDQQSYIEKGLENKWGYDKKYKYSYKMLPTFAMTPRQLREADGFTEKMRDDELKRFDVRIIRFKKRDVYSIVNVKFEKKDGKWSITRFM